MNSLSDRLEELDECGDIGGHLQGLPAKAKKLESALRALVEVFEYLDDEFQEVPDLMSLDASPQDRLLCNTKKIIIQALKYAKKVN